ncbi:(Fe-S)-binding protein [Aquirufa antheringensis]|jgi:L-lactate dehydrogenase complex protein LldE|uniref:(Fe-S)-binding protein n=1 Tax=Aquirufa antheringensis TaxID=2516559 RepID=A0A4Q9BBU3_9BACT|nr:(Fe-S)-binding protein [Aquirufa antheringensis]MCZ2485594.1 (Fe-S)-binding protein [Aquirufa antheringensis]MCZ2486701.1 (Fe-S)-binding protein [Aquirufa antheringensis]MCZ2488518.1 (Fe-S)-binding protein [Aquirufa antheringensis]TBH71928.1 (Fe-S)-binding protein [Aquirufa antheringensis]
MRVALFVPCYIDQFYPQVAVASLELLEKLGCEVIVPTDQTCCGQPMANSGFASSTEGCDTNFTNNFAGFDYIVGPSGSCVLHLKEHHPSEKIRNSVYEICEFLTDVLRITSLSAKFPHRVGLHQSCHGQRGLRLSSMTERNEKSFSKLEDLLGLVEGVEILKPERADECCGFGGTFCVTEEAVSVKMGQDRIKEHDANAVEYIVGADTSCLMHMEGILRRQGSSIQVKHIVEILNHE